MNDRLDFVLIVIKLDYNTNDRLKFISSFIRRENGLNDRSKLVKTKEKKPKLNEIKMKEKKTRNELKSLGFGNLPVEERRTDEERRKTFTDLLTETSRKRYGSTSAWIFLTKTIFFTKNS